MAEQRLVLGVDPGYRTGLAVVDVDAPGIVWQRTYRVLPYHASYVGGLMMTLKELAQLHDLAGAVVQTPIFKGRKMPRWNESAVALAKNASLAGTLAGFLKGIGLAVQEIEPKRGSGMKMSPEMFRAVFGYKGRTSEHARDAANLAMAFVFGMEGKECQPECE